MGWGSYSIGPGGGINCVLLQPNVYFLNGEEDGELDREPEEKS